MNAASIGRVAFAALLVTAAAHAANPVPGHYVAEGGWGYLDIKQPAAKGQPFKLESVGSNAHTCELEGFVKNGRAVLESSLAGKTCTVVFTPSAGAVTVAAVADEPCRDYCGMRAWFAGTYLLPPSDFDNYLPVAKAAWYNAKLCAGGAK